MSVLLKGGFAHCYELIDTETKKIYAGKIVPKSMLTKPHQKDKASPMPDVVSPFDLFLVSITYR
jgi:hypothetical protein